MPTHHLVVNSCGDVIDSEFAALFCNLRVEHNLEQQVTKFIAQFRRSAFACFFDSFKRFVRFFEQHRRECRVSLLAIPGAAVWRAQTIHQGNQVRECGRHGRSLKCAPQNYKAASCSSGLVPRIFVRIMTAWMRINPLSKLLTGGCLMLMEVRGTCLPKRNLRLK